MTTKKGEGRKERVKDKKHDKKGEPKRWKEECGRQAGKETTRKRVKRLREKKIIRQTETDKDGKKSRK